MRAKRKLNTQWEFAKFSIGTGKKEIENGFAGWEAVTLPHDWQIYDTADLYENAEGWYRRKLPLVLAEGEHVLLYFEGVYMDSILYVNGVQAGEWKYGYTSFYFDITKWVHSGDNEILVKTDYRNPNTRWYSGAGIYRNVYLYEVPAVHFRPDCVYTSAACIEGAYERAILEKKIDAGEAIAADTETGTWKMTVEAEIDYPDIEQLHVLSLQGAAVRVLLRDEEKVIVQQDCALDGVDENGLIHTELVVKNPQLWSDKTPNCYTIELQLVKGGEIFDTIANTCGFRVFTYNPARGFFVNGIYTKMKGVCLHHDLGALGSAFHKAAMERQIRVMQEMGCNAIRTSHNPPSPQLLELSDRMGMLVIDEAFDMWERAKTEYDYARFFKEWSAKDVASWVRRDRNHPCIAMWSIGNEIGDTHADEHGQELTRYLMGEVHKHDPLHNAAVTIGSNYMMGENAQKCADIIKMAGYNYAARFYEKHHEEHPDWCVYGSETCSTVQSRGIYHFPLKQSILRDDDEQCSSLGNSTTSWGAANIDQIIWEERVHPYSMGQFLWTGFDYIGEPTPYHTKNSYFGMVDTAGFKKDAFYMMQAGWTDAKKQPMVHLYPYWDFNIGQIIDLRACTNAPQVELFFQPDGAGEGTGSAAQDVTYVAQGADCAGGVENNGLGRSLGRQSLDQKTGRTVNANWQLAYEPGVLTAVAYDEAGNEIARDVKRSFGDAAKLVLHADKTELHADGEDMIFLEISAEDARGNAVENANNRVKVEVNGAAVLVGLDNGDSTDYDSYKGTNRRLFSGKLLAMIGAGLETGDVTVRVTSPELEPAELTLRAVACEKTAEMYASYTANSDMLPAWAVVLPENRPESYGKKAPADEIPVRKLELCVDNKLLTPENNGIVVEAVRYPANATYADMEWRVMNEMGLDVTYATLEKLNEQGSRVKVTAIGDGAFLLRCGVKNGADMVRVLSQIEMKAEGFGAFSINPYEMVSASLYVEGSDGLGSGNEKGVSTPYDVPAWMLYKNVDFGSFGADEVILPVFEFNSIPITFTFWDGVPHAEGSQIIGSDVYHKPSQWDVYQEQTFKLDRRLKGICDFAIELTGKTNIKGFRFIRPDKAFAEISVLDNDGLYGDTFTKEADAVTGIGNNVSIEFADMNFGERRVRKLHVYGRTPLDHNTIQVRFTGADGENSVMAEFVHSEDYNWQSFELPQITGDVKVTFVFLPGCNFDFKKFRFE